MLISTGRIRHLENPHPFNLNPHPLTPGLTLLSRVKKPRSYYRKQMASLAASSTVITTPYYSQSSLLSLPNKPSLLSLRRLSPSPNRTSRLIAAVAGEKSSEDTASVVEIGGGGGEGGFGDRGNGGGGRGDDNGGGGEEESDKKKKMSGMSMSQKLTLGYAALVGGNLTVGDLIDMIPFIWSKC